MLEIYGFSNIIDPSIGCSFEKFQTEPTHQLIAHLDQSIDPLNFLDNLDPTIDCTKTTIDCTPSNHHKTSFVTPFEAWSYASER